MNTKKTITQDLIKGLSNSHEDLFMVQILQINVHLSKYITRYTPISSFVGAVDTVEYILGTLVLRQVQREHIPAEIEDNKTKVPKREEMNQWISVVK